MVEDWNRARLMMVDPSVHLAIFIVAMWGV